MVETVESEDDSDNEECSATSSSGNAGEETRNDFIWSDNDEDSSRNSFNGDVAEPFDLLLCHNCHRHSDEPTIDEELDLDAYPICRVVVTNVHVDSRGFRRKFSTIRSSEYRGGFVPLCVECTRYLTGNRQQQFASVFPAFMWVMLTNEALLQNHGRRLWSLVPEGWRHWWLSSVEALGELSNVTMNDPKPVVKDVTVERNLIEDCLTRNKLAELKRVVNDHFYPTIKCPWGCTNYHVHCGKVPYDILLLRIVGDDLRCYSDLKKRRHVAGIRNDFLDQHEWKETFAWNPIWPVTPSQ